MLKGPKEYDIGCSHIDEWTGSSSYVAYLPDDFKLDLDCEEAKEIKSKLKDQEFQCKGRTCRCKDEDEIIRECFDELWEYKVIEHVQCPYGVSFLWEFLVKYNVSPFIETSVEGEAQITLTTSKRIEEVREKHDEKA